MFAFVHIQKTAGQTFRVVLRKNFGVRHCDTLVNSNIRARDWYWIKLCYPYLESLAGHGVKLTPEFESHFPHARCFTMLREPISRSLSAYQYSLERSPNRWEFPEWMNQHGNRMCWFLCGEENAEQAIEVLETKIGFVGMVERFNESLLLWRHWTGLPHLDLTYSSVNQANTNHIKQQVRESATNMEIAHERNAEDQKLYQYFTDVIYPRQVAAYGDSLCHDCDQLRQQLESANNDSVKSYLGKIKRNLLFRPGTQLSKAA
ncbi:MAG: sulfotransferase family 2 domain-containing protein [Planctomycetaceae bacterium]|nr:sulfotransferase family 2 domain-containing protein [Planctomycetaceae bacterium]